MTLIVLDRSESTAKPAEEWVRWNDVSDPTFEVHIGREGGVLVANSTDIPGLNLEAETQEEMIEEIREWAPDLLRENAVVREGQHFTIVIHSGFSTARIYH